MADLSNHKVKLRHEKQYRTCVLPACKASGRTNRALGFYQFPKDEILRTVWFALGNVPVNVQSLKSPKICGKHFEKKFIGNRQLVKVAMPTLLLGDNFNPDGVKRISQLLANLRADTSSTTYKNYQTILEQTLKDMKAKQDQNQSESLQNLDKNNITTTEDGTSTAAAAASSDDDQHDNNSQLSSVNKSKSTSSLIHIENDKCQMPLQQKNNDKFIGHILQKLRGYDKNTSIITQFLLNNILYEIELNRFKDEQYNPTQYLNSAIETLQPKYEYNDDENIVTAILTGSIEK